MLFVANVNYFNINFADHFLSHIACRDSVTPSLISPAVSNSTSSFLSISSIFAIRTYKTIAEMALYGPFRKKRSPNKHMDGKPFMKVSD